MIREQASLRDSFIHSVSTVDRWLPSTRFLPLHELDCYFSLSLFLSFGRSFVSASLSLPDSPDPDLDLDIDPDLDLDSTKRWLCIVLWPQRVCRSSSQGVADIADIADRRRWRWRWRGFGDRPSALVSVSTMADRPIVMTRERLHVHSFHWAGPAEHLDSLGSPRATSDERRAHPDGAVRVSDTTNISAPFWFY